MLPLAPLLVAFDGFVSCLRSYTETELRELTSGLETETYGFHIGHEATPRALTYVLGIDGTMPDGALD